VLNVNKIKEQSEIFNETNDLIGFY